MINYQRFHVNPPTKPTISQTTCSLGGSELRDTRAARDHAERCEPKLVLAQWPGRSHASRSQCHYWPKLWRCGFSQRRAFNLEHQQHDIFWLVVQLYVFVHFIYLDRYMLPSFRFIWYIGWWSNTILDAFWGNSRWIIWLRLGSKRV